MPDEPAVKKQRKRADAAQLEVLQGTYERNAFPSTEEREALAKMLGLSSRSIQIWYSNGHEKNTLSMLIRLSRFQNKNQIDRRTNPGAFGRRARITGDPDQNSTIHSEYEADKDLVNSGAFKWTIVRPGTLTDDPGTGKASIGRTHLGAPISVGFYPFIT